MLSIGRRTFADVDGDVKNLPSDTTHEFCLCMRRTLKMEATHYTFRGARLVVLHEIDGTYLGVKYTFIVAFEKYPRASVNTLGSSITTPSIAVLIIFIFLNRIFEGYLHRQSLGDIARTGS